MIERERKYLPRAHQAGRFLTAVGDRLSEVVYDADRPVSYARTTYFDTDDFAYAESGVGGVSQRLRLREHGRSLPGQSPQASGLSFLELKQSVGFRRQKTRMAVPGRWRTADGAPAPWAPPRSPEDRRLLLALATPGMRARVVTWYRRRSFIAARHHIRVTVDTEVAFFAPVARDPAGRFAPGGRHLGDGPDCVIEIKTPDEHLPAWLARAAMHLGPARSVSKYSLAVEALLRGSQRRPANDSHLL